MKIEWWILLSVYAVATCILFFIPKNKIRLAVVAFLFKQVITFLIGLLVVEFGLIEYPVRSFASVNRTSLLIFVLFQVLLKFVDCNSINTTGTFIFIDT
ncbi:CBO0543 family protein [Bacillus sp. UNC41MFS5]|uniref:CBO0543 family protein n=1 Tax=Bacillus sp. UNC41MFS5 TaxID=1449046 RepID=UPI001E50B43B|nr:CBO0543 family protein [Bacillus sp. UNC41MFS5]